MAALNEIRIPAEIVIPIKTTTESRAPAGLPAVEDEIEVTVALDWEKTRIEVDGHTIATQQWEGR